MHKNAMKCNETLSKWCKNKHGASKIIDTFETYQLLRGELSLGVLMMDDMVLCSALFHHSCCILGRTGEGVRATSKGGNGAKE
jgi:hypothetical protein